MIEIKHIDFLNQNKLSSEEFTIAYFIYQDKQRDDINEKFQLYVENNAGKFDYKQLLINLEDQDYIINHNRIGNYDLSKIKVTDKFKDMLFVDKSEAFKEVKSIYPPNLNFNEKGGSTKLYPTFNDTSELLYNNYIEGRKDKHYRFLEITRRYIEDNGGKAVYTFEHYLPRFDSIADMYESEFNKGNFEFDILT